MAVKRLLLLAILVACNVSAADFGDIPANLTLSASQSVRRNAGNTLFEAYTPGSGGSVSITATAPIVVTPSPITGTGVISVTSGDLTDVGTDGITIGSGSGAVLGTGTTISQHVSDVSHNGYLSSSDWGTFNGKGSGTVTSVGLSGTSNQITVTGSTPITSSGSWTLSIPTAAQLNVAKLTNLTTNGFVKTGSGDGTLSVDTATYVPTTRSLTIGTGTGGGAQDLSADRTWLSSVTNDAQTKAAIVPNTAPAAGQILVGNTGGTAYAPQTVSGSGATITASSSGVLTISAIANASLVNTAVANLSGTNTGDQTSVSGNAGTATALQNARTIGGVSFDGTGNIVPQTIQSINEATDTTCFPLFISASGSQSLQPLNNTALTFNSNTGAFGATSFSGAGTGLTGTAASLTAGNVTTNANLTGAVTSSGNATSLGSFTSANLRTALTDENGTGVALFDSSTSATFITPALGTPASGVMTNVTGTADGLTAGDVTRNHAVYAGASPPTVDVGIFTIAKTGVDLKSAGTTTIFTVPANRTYMITGMGVAVTAVTSGGAGVQNLNIKESSSARLMSDADASGSVTPVANQTVWFVAANINGALMRSNCTAGNSVQAVIAASHAGSTAVTGTIFVTGFYTQ